MQYLQSTSQNVNIILHLHVYLPGTGLLFFDDALQCDVLYFQTNNGRDPLRYHSSPLPTFMAIWLWTMTSGLNEAGKKVSNDGNYFV